MNKRLPRIKYVKLLLLLLTFVAAYALFKCVNFLPFNNFLLSLGLLGTFLAGIFFAYGFTAAPATAVLLVLANDQNVFLAGFIAGFGALTGDFIIFRFVRHSFADEIEKLSREGIVQRINRKIPVVLRKYVIPVFAGFVIASPLPDEIGVSLLAASKLISTRIFFIASYLLNTAGIFIILALGKLI